MSTSIEAHRLFTAAPVACDCHQDRGQPVPRFAAEAAPSNQSHATSILETIPQPPPDIDPLTWLAVVQAAVAALTQAAERLEKAKPRRQRPRNRPPRSNLCSECASHLAGSGFRHRMMFVVQDANGNVRCATLTEKHAYTIAADKAQTERRDFVILTLPGYIATPKHATSQVLIRAGSARR